MDLFTKKQKNYISGIDLIIKERGEQLSKHNRSIEYDVLFNNNYQLSQAASILSSCTYGDSDIDLIVENHCPEGWDKDIWRKMVLKPYEERLIIAGALIAAEIDRLNYIENNK